MFTGWTFPFKSVFDPDFDFVGRICAFAQLHTKRQLLCFFKTINVFTERNRVGFACKKASSGPLTVNSMLTFYQMRMMSLKKMDHLPKRRRPKRNPFQFLNRCHIFKKGTAVKKLLMTSFSFSTKNQENNPERSWL